MRMLWCSILSAVLLVSLAQANPLSNPPAAGSSAQSGSEAANSLDSTKNGLLPPESVHPSAYTIILEPRLEGDFTFSGESNIDVNIATATDKIVLHAAGLKIEENSISLVNASGGDAPPQPTKPSPDSDNELLTIEFAEPIKKGTYTLKLRYTGTLETDPKGFYRSERQIDELNVWEAFTQFNSSYARRAFPCFDETVMKARFTISIKHPENYAVNSKVLTVRDTESDKSLTQFTTTGLMSTDEIDFEVVYMKQAGDNTTATVAPTTPTDESSGNSTTTDESSGNSTTTDESSGNSTTTDESSGNSTTTDESSGNSTTTDESSGNSTTTEESSGNSTTTDESSGNSTTDESSGSSTTDVSSGSSTTDESSGSSTTDESSGSSTTDESSGSSTTDESSGSSTTDESSGSSTQDTNGATAAPSTTGAGNISLPTLPFTIFIGLLARLVVAQVV